MKTVLFCLYLIALCNFNSLYAQEKSGSGKLFPQFEEGIVFFKNGGQASAKLNYDMIQDQMLFLGSDSTEMKISDPLDVVIVKIGERRFLPASSRGAFYEEIQAGEGSFFVQRVAFYLSAGKAAGYGGYSQTQASSSVGNLQTGGLQENLQTGGMQVNGENAKLSSGDKFRLVTNSIYYLQIEGKYKKFNSAKTLGNLFKGHESEIETFADKESIDFRKMEDVARIVEYGYSLK